MIKMHGRSLAVVSIIFLSLLSLCGCSGYGGGTSGSHREITIDSDPQHATVYAEGTEIGMTPLVIRPDEVFQARFTMGDSDTGGIVAFRYVGMLSIKKDGCKSYTTQVDDNILARDIHVKLECDPAHPADKALPTPPAQAPVSRDLQSDRPAADRAPASPDLETNRTAGDAEERLMRIESLYKKGLLSEEEYQTLRQRVLDTL